MLSPIKVLWKEEGQDIAEYAVMLAVIIAVIWIAIGNVLSALSTASACPISALIAVCPDITAFISA